MQKQKKIVKIADLDLIKTEAAKLYENDRFDQVIRLFQTGLAICDKYESQWKNKLPRFCDLNPVKLKDN